MGELARSRGALDPEAHRDWVNALIRSGRLDDAVAATGEALGTLAPRGEVRATIAERLVRLTASTGDDQGAIVSAKHRGAYGRAARLAVACAEAIALARDRERGFAFVIGVRERFPRHHAFRSELDRATSASPYLPSPPRRRGRRVRVDAGTVDPLLER